MINTSPLSSYGYKMKKSILFLGIIASWIPTAHADLPPPPGYEEKCTIAKQQQIGEKCISCGDAYHSDVDACKIKYEPQGYVKKCQTSGASVWTEIWCKPSDNPEQENKQKQQKSNAKTNKTKTENKTENKSSGCSHFPIPDPVSGGLLTMGLLLGLRKNKT